MGFTAGARRHAMQMIQNRRRFLAAASSAAASGLVGATASFPQDAPPEITSIRIAKNNTICIAPQYVAEAMLRAEGFTDIQYLERAPAILSAALGRGEVDFSLHLSAPSIVAIDAGERIAMVGGVHTGCLELFANERIHSIRDLKAKKVGVQAWGATPHIFLTTMVAYVGLDPTRDIDWVLSPSVSPMELFIDGKIDAFLGTPPE